MGKEWEITREELKSFLIQEIDNECGEAEVTIRNKKVIMTKII